MTEIGIIAVGGYNEMGRNMTGVRIDNDIIVLDMGLQLDRVQIHEDVEIDKMHSMDLIKMGAIPDDTIMKDAGGSVKAIVCTHGHLDHIGAIPKLAHRYKAPIIATPYTAELVKHEISDEKKFRVNNEVIPLKIGGHYNVTPDIQIEFIRIQHSIVDSAFAAIHTPDGVVLYASDFKLDRTPTIGEAPAYSHSAPSTQSPFFPAVQPLSFVAFHPQPPPAQSGALSGQGSIGILACLLRWTKNIPYC